MTVPADFLEQAAHRMAGGEGELGGFVFVDEVAEANPYHDARGRFASKGGRGGVAGDRSALDATLTKVEDEIRTLDGGEILVAVNADGSIHHRTLPQMGDPDGPGPRAAGVSLDPATAASFRGKVVTHNHPLLGDSKASIQRGDSFSPDDIMSAASANVAELRMVNATSKHALRPGPDGWGSPMKIDSTARRVIDDALEKGDITIVTGGRQVFTLRLAQAMGWTYEVVHDASVL